MAIFGFNSPFPSSANASAAKWACQLTMPTFGNITKISIYTRGYSGADNAVGFIYSDLANVPNTRLVITPAVNFPDTTARWYDFILSTPYYAPPGTVLWFGHLAQTTTVWYQTGGDQLAYWNFDAGYPTPANPFGGVTDSVDNSSLYVTYDDLCSSSIYRHGHFGAGFRGAKVGRRLRVVGGSTITP